MPISNKYKSIETLHENDFTIVRRALRLKDNKSVIIKSLKSSSINEVTLTLFSNEQRMLSQFNSKNIIKILDVISMPPEYRLVLEDIEGDSLCHLLLNQEFNLAEILNIALSSIKALHVIHNKEIIHADISPKNIVYNPQTFALQIIDFGYSFFKDKTQLKQRRDIITSGSLFYMAPEQTGLTLSKMDERSDLYSFGMTLYHLILGRTPFEAIDRQELIHKQIALIPVSLHKLNKRIPPVLSDIIDKLIQKDPNARYQNCQSLEYDIKYCLKKLDSSGQIEPFPIATQNSPKIEIGTEIFGREDELEVLKEEAKKVLSDLPARLLVSGVSGIGKTRLIEEFLTYFDQKTFHIIKGSFEQYRSSYPYLSFKQLFVQLHTVMLSQTIKKDFSALSDRHLSLLSFVFPPLQAILPKTTREELSDMDIQSSQLGEAVRSFFALVATEESPLIIFMDNLQWADEPSLELIQKAIINSKNPYISLINSYRNDEVQNNTKAAQFIQSLQDRNKGKFLHIKLLELSEQSLKQMLEHAFCEKNKTISALASIVYKKTDGNPFYIKSFVGHIIDEGDVFFQNGKWKFSLEKIKSLSSSMNIADIITSKFDRLHPKEQSFLQYLAILGNRFNLDLCLDIMQSLRFSKNLQKKILSSDIIDVDREFYQFAHDRIHEYIYNTLTQEQKRHIHHSIGKYLQSLYEKGSYSDTITLVHHMNSAHNKDSFPKKLFLLNLTGLEEMLVNNAYKLALETSNWIQTHFPDLKSSNQTHASVFHYRALRIRILYLNALHDEALKQVRLLIQDTRTINERLSCFTLFKDVCVTQGQYFNELLLFGNKIFKSLGLNTPETEDETSLRVKELQKKICLSHFNKRPTEILQLPVVHEISHQKILALLVDYWEGAYYLANIERMQWAYLTILEHSFKHGNSTESCFAYVLYGAQLVSQKEYEKARLFAEVSLKLNASFNDKIMLPKVHNFVANFISPYSKPLLSNLPLYKKSLSQSKINGDLIFGTWANFLMHFSHFLSGTSLETCRQSICAEKSFIMGSGDVKMISIFKFLIQTIDTLQDVEYLDIQEEETAVRMWQEKKFYPALAWYGIIKAQDCFLDADYEKGLDYLQTYVHTSSNEVIMFPKIRLHFIRALLLMGKMEALNTREKALLRSDLDEFASFYKASARNFKFEHLLLKAESSKHLKSHWDTAKEYDLALKEAKRVKNPFYQTLAGLSTSRFWKERSYEDLSHSYLNEALSGLNQWGAYAKAKKLNTPFILPTSIHESIKDSTVRATSYSKASPENLQTLVKPFFKLTQAQNNDELVSTLMKAILETATASRAILIFKEENTFKIKAELDFKEGQITTYDLDIEHSSISPNKLISYAINTEENVSVNYPAKSGKFQSDRYIKEFRPASCLVIPSLLEGSIKGVLYLENQDIVTPLSEETKKTLELLLTQATIIFKNTSLLDSLIRGQNNLNKAQEISHVGSWDYNSANNKILWSAETYRIYELEPFSIDIDYDWFIAHLHPDDVEYIRDAVEKALQGERIYDVQHRILTSKGKVKTVHQRATVYTDAEAIKMSGTIQDITKETKAKELINSLSQVVDQNPFTTIITDTNGVITHLNAQTHKMTGYQEDELLGNNMKLFSSKKHPEKLYKELWKTIKEDKAVWRGTFINKMKNGELKDCDSTIFPIFNTNHEIVNFVTIQEDITEQLVKEKLFLIQTRQAQMGEMLSMIAHQWRQPLSIISALMNQQRVRIALEKSSMDEIIENYDNIETQVMHLSNTINDFKDFFKPDKAVVPTKSSTMISKALALSEYLLTKSNIQVNIDYIIDSSYMTFEREVEQVIINLVSNAKDAILECKIKEPCITITSNEIDAKAVISIEDNAGGIEDSVIDTLFLPYISTKTERHGTGLGLYMCKTIIEEHCHGEITSENTKDGAKFTISIPLKGIHE